MGAEEGIWVRGSGYYLMWWGRGGGRVLGAAGPRLLLNVFGVCMHLQAQDGDRDVQRLITPSMQPGPVLGSPSLVAGLSATCPPGCPCMVVSVRVRCGRPAGQVQTATA